MQSPRLKIAASHLVLSLAVILAPAMIFFCAWYPAEWRPFTGGAQMLVVVLLASLVGPAISLFIYKTNRRLLLMDLVVIAVVQLVTAAIAMHALHQGRAQWIVFVKDDWRILRPIDMQSRSLRLPGDLIIGPRWIGARYADDETTRAQQVTQELVDGVTVESFASSHVPVASVLGDVIRTMRSFDRLAKYNSSEAILSALAAAPEARGWLPLKGIARDGVVLVDADGKPLRPVALAPWEPD